MVLSSLNRFLRSTTLFRAAALVVGWLCLVAPQACAQSLTDTMFTRSFGGRDVLAVNTVVDVSPQCTFGVARAVVSSNKPSTADRDLTIVFYLKSYGSQAEGGVAYRVPVRLEEGKSRAQVEIPHVQYMSAVAWDVSVYEDGRDIEDKRRNVNSGSAIPNYISNEGEHYCLNCLCATNEPEAEFLDFAEAFDEGLLGNNRQRINRNGSNKRVVPIREASHDWRSYLGAGCWLASVQAVKEINQSPAVAQALRTYISSGGCVLIHDVQDTQAIRAIARLLAIEDEKVDEWLSVSDLSGTDLVSRRVAFGQVHISDRPLMAISSVIDPNQFARENAGFASLNQNLDGNWFWRNLIRSVGKPPIWMFCAMVTLFGAVLGPGLLVVTGRMARRSLMILLVPAISLVTTFAIVAYSVVNEGFETHVRVTSVQALDPVSQQSFVWSRQNYFSGLPPREGLNLSPLTYARPVLPEQSYSNYSSDPKKNISRTVNLLPDQQIWSGWLKPRQQQQVLIGHSVAAAKMPVSIQQEQKNSVRLANESQAELLVVLVRGSGDDYYLAEKLAVGGALTVAAIDEDAASLSVSKLMVDYRPESPPELRAGGSLLDFGSSARRARVAANAYEADDVLNTQFQRNLSDKLDLPKFGFAVLATESDIVEVPLDGRSTENLHLIVGVQPW